ALIRLGHRGKAGAMVVLDLPEPVPACGYAHGETAINTYSCWASRMIKACLPSRSPTTKLKPTAVGSIRMKDVVPSSFRREATELYHLPKSKIVAPSCARTTSSPRAGLT